MNMFFHNLNTIEYIDISACFVIFISLLISLAITILKMMMYMYLGSIYST